MIDKEEMLERISDTYRKIVGKNKYTYATYRCKCGNIKDLVVNRVNSGITKSCGCLKRRQNIDYVDGKIHPIYQLWVNMRANCKNQNRKNYCGPNIKVCEEWKEYRKFYTWAIQTWQKSFNLIRINTNKDFCPENCKFVSKVEAATIHSNRTKNNRENTCIKKYGVTNPSKLDEVKRKIETTNIIRYGSKISSQNDNVKKKAIETCIKRYGKICFSKTNEFKEKRKETLIRKYGIENFSNRDKFKSTCIKKYGVDNPAKNRSIFEKICQTKKTKYGNPFFGQTNGNSENEVRKWFETLTSKEFKSDRTILGTKELDMYNPELMVAIEFCGIYWHSEHKGGTRQSHVYKYNECKKQNIRLYTIFSDEWAKRNSQVKSFLKASLGYHKDKYFARKCTVKQIDKKVGRNFIEAYHIQGQKRTAHVYFGIFNQDELIGVMSLAKHHRNNKDIVLDRLAFKEDVLLIGGASKLLSNAKKWLIDNNYTKLISWSDNRWSYGNVYKSLGFVLADELGPDYSYVHKNDKNNRVPKQNAKKSKIKCQHGQTESERMAELGYARIWDCGKMRWELNI